MDLVYLPNIITVLRLFLVPVIVWMIVANELSAAFVALSSGGPDRRLDGFLARRFGWQTELGAYLDPVADKALLVSVYAALGFFGHLPAWLVILVVSRDLLIIGAVMLSWLMGRAIGVHPLVISKVNTAAADRSCRAGSGRRRAETRLGPAISAVLIWGVGLTTALSAAIYLVIWMKRMARYDLDQRAENPAGTHPRNRRAAE